MYILYTFKPYERKEAGGGPSNDALRPEGEVAAADGPVSGVGVDEAGHDDEQDEADVNDGEDVVETEADFCSSGDLDEEENLIFQRVIFSITSLDYKHKMSDLHSHSS